jgi:excisionase family DNA binding protein
VSSRKVCRATVYNLIARKELTALKIGRSTRILATDLDDFIARNRVASLTTSNREAGGAEC